MRGHKSLKITRPAVVVTDEDINAELTRLQERNSRMVSVEDRGAELGDTVTFDFEGFVDDVAFEGGKAENHALVLGSGQFIPGFEEQLVGATIDAELDVNVTFPENYGNADLNGKEVIFFCKLYNIGDTSTYYTHENIDVYMLNSSGTAAKMYRTYENYNAEGEKEVINGSTNHFDGGHIPCKANKAFMILSKEESASKNSFSLRYE